MRTEVADTMYITQLQTENAERQILRKSDIRKDALSGDSVQLPAGLSISVAVMNGRRAYGSGMMLLFVGCLTSLQHASVSQGRICSDKFTCRHTEIQVADQTFHLTQSQYTDTGPTCPGTDPITSGAWQGSH